MPDKGSKYHYVVRTAAHPIERVSIWIAIVTLLAEAATITAWVHVWLNAGLPLPPTKQFPHYYESVSLLLMLYALVLVGLIGTRFRSRALILAATVNIPFMLVWAVAFGHARVMVLIVGAAIWGNLWLMSLFKMFSDSSQPNDDSNKQLTRLPIGRAFAGTLVVFPATVIALHEVMGASWPNAAYSATGISFAGTGLMIALAIFTNEEFMLGCGVHLIRIAFFSLIWFLVVKYC